MDRPSGHASFLAGAALLGAVLAAAACTDSVGPAAGTVEVRVATTGADLDADGYTLALDTDVRTVAVNDTVLFEGLAAGIYAVTIGGVADNCDVAGTSTRSAPVVTASTVQIAYAVTCEAIPTAMGEAPLDPR